MTLVKDVFAEWRCTDDYLGWWVRTACELVIRDGFQSKDPLSVESEAWLVKALPIAFSLRDKKPTELKKELLELKETAPKAAWGRASYPGEQLFERLDDSLFQWLQEKRKRNAAR